MQDEEEHDDEESDEESNEDEMHNVFVALNSGEQRASKLWGPAQFPEGMRKHALWDWSNIQAAQAWTCPCAGTRNCIGQERIRPEDLLVHRKNHQTSLKCNMRDTARASMASHYNKETKNISCSFVVGHLNDCCAASRGLADGYSWNTWSRARADLRGDKPLHAGRCEAKSAIESDAARIINAYIRNLRLGMEGSKGGSRGQGKTFTGKQAIKQRWETFKASRTKARLPVVGSQRLFAKSWAQQDGLVELEAKGHALCDECFKIRNLHDQIDDRTDEAGRQQQRDLELREEIHRSEHRGERSYGDDMWDVAENQPHKVTMLNMDAPTQVNAR